MFLQSLVIIGTAYLLGAVPTAYIVSHRMGMDLRTAGDANLGARNAFNVLGPLPGLMIGTVDVFKGALAVWIAKSTSTDPSLPYFAALAAALGHDFSIYIRFQGGQGMAAILGAMLLLQPRETLAGLGVWVPLYVVTRNWDLSCFAAIIVLFGLGIYFGRPVVEWLLVATLVVTIGIKKLVDTPLRVRIGRGHR